MQNKKNNKGIQLNSWLFKKPVLFAASFFTVSTVLLLIYAAIGMVFNFDSIYPIYALFLISFIICTWYIIKKLPHDKMNQNDFVAITNGSTLISVISSFVAMLFIVLYGPTLKTDLLLLYLMHQPLCITLFLILGAYSLYLIGLAICGIYAKYKRAASIGITPWKIILSMPFAFLLMWTPGYLLQGKDIKNNLQIKCGWFSRFQQWVMKNGSNILFMFLFLTFCKSIVTGWATFFLYATLLIIYALWYTKHKSDFIKNIDNGYTMTAVGINIAILLTVITMA